MWRLLLCAFVCTLGPSSEFGQSNTTAGLAGASAGAALAGASGQNATTPSSAGGGAGGASSPIEIQVMSFKGLQKIAEDIANITDKYRNVCVHATDTPNGLNQLQARDAELSSYIEKLSNQTARKGHVVISESELRQVEGDLKKLDEAAKATTTCEVLIVDPTAANQLGLYHAIEGYYQQLSAIHAQLQSAFSLIVDSARLTFTAIQNAAQPPPQTLTVTNRVPKQDVSIGKIVIEPPNAPFKFVSRCPSVLNPSGTCTIDVSYVPPDTATARADKAELRISTALNPKTINVQLAGEVRGLTPEEIVQKQNLENSLHDLQSSIAELQKQVKKAPTARSRSELSKTVHSLETSADELKVAVAPAPVPVANAAAQGAAPATNPPPAVGAGAATPAIGFTYLGDVMTALAAAKGTNTYASSSFQATTQAFTVLLESELKTNHQIASYTSSSIINLASATGAAQGSLTKEFAEMLNWGNEIAAWSNNCKPDDKGKLPGGGACEWSDVVTDLAVGQQMVTGFALLMSTANDGTGGSTIVDAMRGKILANKLAMGMLSIQVAVVAAGGSSKSNSPFGAALFYQWAPSYNAGAIATFEIRNAQNELLQAGARSALYGYGKWNPGGFDSKSIEHTVQCTFCSSTTKKP